MEVRLCSRSFQSLLWKLRTMCSPNTCTQCCVSCGMAVAAGRSAASFVPSVWLPRTSIFFAPFLPGVSGPGEAALPLIGGREHSAFAGAAVGADGMAKISGRLKDDCLSSIVLLLIWVDVGGGVIALLNSGAIRVSVGEVPSNPSSRAGADPGLVTSGATFSFLEKRFPISYPYTKHRTQKQILQMLCLTLSYAMIIQ